MFWKVQTRHALRLSALRGKTPRPWVNDPSRLGGLVMPAATQRCRGRGDQGQREPMSAAVYGVLPDENAQGSESHDSSPLTELGI